MSNLDIPRRLTGYLALGLCLFVLHFAVGCTVSAQSSLPTARPDQLRHFRQYVGNWSIEERIQSTPLSAPEHWTGDHQFELFDGGFFVVHRWTDANDLGEVDKGIEIIDYDAKKRMYAAHAYSSRGWSEVFPYVVRGDTLHYADVTLAYKGKTGTQRCTGVFTTTTFVVTCRVSLDRKKWLAQSVTTWARRR